MAEGHQKGPSPDQNRTSSENGETHSNRKQNRQRSGQGKSVLLREKRLIQKAGVLFTNAGNEEPSDYNAEDKNPKDKEGSVLLDPFYPRREKLRLLPTFLGSGVSAVIQRSCVRR